MTTTEKKTGREQINKSLRKEIKTALGQSKYEKFQQTIYEKRKEIKKKEWEASQKEKNKRERDEIMEQQNLESLKNSEAPQREIDKSKAKIRTLEAEHIKARNKFLSSYQAEKDKSNLEELQLIEDIQEEDSEEQEEENASEALKAIKRGKEAIDWRKKIELHKTLDPDAPPEQRQAAKEKLLELNQSYEQIVAEEKIFEERLGVKRSLLDKERETLQKRKEELEEANKEDKKIINDRDADPHERTNAEERVAVRENEIRQITAQLEEIMSLREKVKETSKNMV